jgi:hypothetical protein
MEPAEGSSMLKLRLTAHSLKATLVLDPAQIATVEVPPGTSAVEFAIRLDDGRTLTRKFNAKTLRRAAAAAAAGPAAIVVQGRLAPGDILAEAGISAQPKTEKPATTPHEP